MKSAFNSRFSFDSSSVNDAKICVVGVGGGGGNAVNNMIARGIRGVEFVAVNTDVQALQVNKASVRIQTGSALTKGLGAGARPSVGAEAVEENREEIEQVLQGFDMVFITAGMGGGTGTGGAPIIAAISRSLGILTVAIVTRPFDCEGSRRRRTAEEGIALLCDHADTLIVVPNERLLDIVGDQTSLLEAFSMVDDVLYNATRGISDLITVHGLINLDFADVKTTMQAGGKALMGAASASGKNRAEVAANEAISSPLLDGLSIAGASNILVNITASRSLGIKEATTATSVVKKEAGEDVEVIFGTVLDEAMGDELRVTVIATGFDKDVDERKGRRRQVSLEMPTPIMGYKGEDNLKYLDTPAYERRGRVGDEEEPEQKSPSRKASADPPRKAKIRRLRFDELKGDADRPDKDNDTPAFLGKMMD